MGCSSKLLLLGYAMIEGNHKGDSEHRIFTMAVNIFFVLPAHNRPPGAGSPRLCSGQAGEANAFLPLVVADYSC